MQFHKRVAISVTLTSWTWGTATFTPATGTSYALSSLPIGSKIDKSSSSLYVITNSSGTTLWSISLSESSWYEISDCDIVRWWMHVAINNTTLEDWDTIEAIFKANTIRIYLDGGSYWAFYDEYSKKISYVDIPRVDTIRFEPMQNNVDWYIEAYYNGQWIPFASYSYFAWNVASFTALNTPYQIQIDFETNYWSYYYFPDMWNLPSWYQHLDTSAFIMELTHTCDLVSYSQAQIQSPSDITAAIEYALYQNYPSLKVQQWRSPYAFNYIFYDWVNRYWIWRAMCQYPWLNPWEMLNWEVVVPFFYDWYNTYSTPFDYQWFARWELPYWTSTGYSLDPSLLDRIFSQWETNAVQSLESWWGVSDVCDLWAIIHNLATKYIV